MDESGDRYASSLAAVIQSAAVPYGVTLTVWASGASVEHFRGAPKPFEIFLFVLGGTCAYATLVLVARRALGRSSQGSAGRRMTVTGVLHPLAIGGAVGVVMLIARIGSWAAWPLGGFAGIGLYLALVGGEHLLARRLPLAR